MARSASPTAARAAAMAIVQNLRKAGHIAYFAGGCVRDELLNLSPTDYDIATDATPDRIKSIFKRTNEVGAAFGVVLVTPTPEEGAAQQATVEVATFRSDGPYSDRRRPDVVTFSDPESDARRRDFTVNALFIDTVGPPAGSTASGKVIDFVGGQADLARRVIRAVGDPEARLAEDHLRALRAVRLAARLAFTIDPATAQAIQVHAADLKGVSRERIGEEVRRMLTHTTRAESAKLLEGLGLDAPVLNEPHTSSSGPSLLGLSIQPGDSLYPASLAAWACDRGLKLSDTATTVQRWRAALCLSNEESQSMEGILMALGALEQNWPGLGIAGKKRLAGANPGFAPALALFKTRNSQAAEALASEVSRLAHTPSGLCPEPFVTGDDLIAEGRQPGPQFKTLLDTLYDAQLEDRVSTRGEALELSRRLGI